MVNEAPKITRASTTFTPTFQAFTVKNREYSQQYSHVYSKRLLGLGRICKDRALAALGSDASSTSNTARIIELEDNKRSIVVGVIMKEMANRKEVIGNSSEEGPSASLEDNLAPLVQTISDMSDTITLEDDSGRVNLIFPSSSEMEDGTIGDTFHPSQLVTGMVMCVLGSVLESGDLKVEGQFSPSFPTAPKTVESEASKTSPASFSGIASKTNPSVMLCSGLNLGSGEGANSSLSYQLLLDYLSGANDGSGLDSKVSGAHVARVVIAGGAEKPEGASSSEESSDSTAADSNIKNLDLNLHQLTSLLPVDLMPSKDSSTNVMLPMQPYHPCLLPRSNRFKSLNLCPNPYSARIGGVSFLGSSGEAINDMKRYTAQPPTDGDEGKATLLSSMDLLMSTLQFCHLSPTAPDSLPCYPFYETDPFVISNGTNNKQQQNAIPSPQVYFCGGCDSFETKMTDSGVRVVCVPDFWWEGVVVKVDLVTLECEVVKFEF
jgi:DNA polymerase delta subunit 2